jgi:phosphoribosylglycinamide formyltransferase 1
VRVNVAVLISGNGSNLQALMDASAAADYPADIALVISNNADAYGLARAARAGIETLVISHRDYTSREAFDSAMDAALRARGIQLVCLAGFMRVLSDGFVRSWQGRMINIHPSLLPKYKGLHTHARALAAGDTQHGATVHWVIAELDAGEIIAQDALDIAADDTPETLAERVHALEHQLYPAALAKVALQFMKR